MTHPPSSPRAILTALRALQDYSIDDRDSWRAVDAEELGKLLDQLDAAVLAQEQKIAGLEVELDGWKAQKAEGESHLASLARCACCEAVAVRIGFDNEPLCEVCRR